MLNELNPYHSSSWPLFLEKEFTSAIVKCNNLSAPGPDKLSWRHLKHVIKDKMCLQNIITIANACIELGYWPNHFKKSMMIVISKPNKMSYNSSKSFRPIVLLNTLGKLIEKVIGNRLQFYIVSNNFIYQSQLDRLKFKSTTNAGIALTYFIYMRWIKNMSTSLLVFDIAQFFLSLNYRLLTLILGKAGFDLRVVKFFLNYLFEKKTKYFWNNFSSSQFEAHMGVGQGLALSPILSALYLSPFLYILEKRLKNLNLNISILSFVNNSLFLMQSKSFRISNACLFSSYNITFNLLSKFSFLVKYLKTEVFHFSRSHGIFNPPPLNLSTIGSPILCSKEIWRHLGFIFDRKLFFCQYINFYTNKAISTVKCMKILGNLTRGLIPHQKHLLYRSYTLPIALYGFQM